jgi:transcriptional regulator with XRE-family HTH domain
VTTETFGERLRRLREARGLRKTALARLIGLTEAAIRQLESAAPMTPAWPTACGLLPSWASSRATWPRGRAGLGRGLRLLRRALCLLGLVARR